MEVLLLRRQEDSGQRQLDNDIMALRANSYVRHMNANGIRPEQYDEVYELAMSIYNEQEIRGPFGVDFMIQAAKRMKQLNKGYEVYSRPKHKALPSCSTCQGSKISYKMNGSQILGINKNEDGSIKKCEDCSV